MIYAAMKDGSIVRFDASGSNLSVFAEPGGRPLGLEFDAAGNLLVANAYSGLQRIAPDGTVEVLADSYRDEPIRYADDVAVANNGVIYFSDASSKFGASESGGSLEASILDLLEHGGHGRVYRYDPATDSLSVLMDDLQFANGVAIAEDQRSLFVNETSSYRVLRYWLDGPEAGKTEVVIDNLPGFPDNINNGLNGRLWIGLVFPRNQLVDELSGSPWARKIILRLPAALRPQPVATSHVIAINADGEVLMNLQDTSATMPALTGVYETRDTLWLTSLLGNRAGRLDKRDLAYP
jgi:sugar lactone lactonase YvrE